MIKINKSCACRYVLPLILSIGIQTVYANSDEKNDIQPQEETTKSCHYKSKKALSTAFGQSQKGLDGNHAIEGDNNQRSRVNRSFDNKMDSRSLATGATPKYIIPVVFHIYGDTFDDRKLTEEQRNAPGFDDRIVDEERVRETLAKINADFAGFNDEVDPSFADIEGSMDVEFRLAQIDPDGNTTNGIIYHEYQEGFALNASKDVDIQKYAWDNYRYMNVHIQHILKNGSNKKSGTAWLPSSGMSDEGTARVVFNGRYLRYNTTSGASSITHEFGHFFNLEHVFKDGGCIAGDDKGDKVADTPPTKGSLGCGTQVNCFGQLVNSQNHMDYNACEAMFTKGQVARMEEAMQHPSRITLWQPENLIATGVNGPLGKRVLFNYSHLNDDEFDKYSTLLESIDNDGTITNKKKIKAVDGARFSQSSGRLVEGRHFRTQNLPDGLRVQITVLDETTAEISLTGQAQSHEADNSSAFTLTLLNAAIDGGVRQLYSASGKFNIEFLNRYGNSYGNLERQIHMGWSAVNSGRGDKIGFSSPSIGGDLLIHLVNFDGDTVGINNFINKVEVLVRRNTHEVLPLLENDNISASSRGDWYVRGDIKEYVPVITSKTYRSWYGRVGYAAIRVPTITGQYLYGWLKFNVSRDGSMVNLIGYGINEQPDRGILTGVGSNPALNFLNDMFNESNDNDGSVDGRVNIELDNANFAKRGDLIQGVHFEVKNLPDGLNLHINVSASRKATVSLRGNARRHDWGDTTDKVELELLNAAFEDVRAADLISSAKKLSIAFIGKSVQKTLSGKTAKIRGDTGSFSLLHSSESFGKLINYQAMDYTDQTSGNVGGFKFISKRKDAVANANFELTPLDFGTVIGPDSQWMPGREYWSERGQHMIDSDDYRLWRNKTKYVGIRFRRAGKIHYGWIKMRLSVNGTTLQFLEYGLSGQYDTPIRAGTTEAVIDSHTLRDACASEAPTRARTIVAGKTVCLSSGSNRNSFSLGNSKAYKTIGIRTAHGTGDLSLYAKNGGWPDNTGRDPHSTNPGNKECILISKPAGSGRHWTYIEVIGQKSNASLLVEVDVDENYCRF